MELIEKDILDISKLEKNRQEIRDLIIDKLPAPKKSVSAKWQHKPYFFKNDGKVYRYETSYDVLNAQAGLIEQEIEKDAGLSLYEAKVYRKHIVFPNAKIYKGSGKEIAYTTTKFDTVTVYLEGKKPYVHTVIANCFIPNPYNYKHVKHKDGNKKNNVVENLEWASLSSLQQHSEPKKKRGGNPKPIPPQMKRIVTEEVYSGRYKESDLLDNLYKYFKDKEVVFSEDLEPVIEHKSKYPIYKDYILYIPVQGVFYEMQLKYVTRQVMCVSKFSVLRGDTEVKKAKEIISNILCKNTSEIFKYS